MDVPDFVPRESHHILLKRGDHHFVIDDESWKTKRNRQEMEGEGWRTGSAPAHDILDHGHWLTRSTFWDYNVGHDFHNRCIRSGRIFEDKCIYCEAAEHGIPFQKILDVFNECNEIQDEWIKQLECLWLEYCEVEANVKPAKQ